MLRPFIDAHVHLNQPSPALMHAAEEYGAYYLSINTDIPFFPPLDQQENTIHLLNTMVPRAFFMTSFDMKTWGTDSWQENALAQIKLGLKNGARGVKIWKNLGMDEQLRTTDGAMLMVDNEAFDPVFKYIEDNNIVLIGHQGEPKNCWLPLEQMTMNSDRDYFSAHPEYHMFLHPEYPSYEEQMAARDRLLEKFPKLTYVGLHLFSLEWNLDEVSKRLHLYPNTMTDLAERICHVQFQTMQDREKVRSFFIEHQDRIIYGTDVIDDGVLSPAEISEKIKKLWHFHWTYFSTDQVMTAPEFEGSFKGLDLSEEVLHKIFYENAVKTYGLEIPHQ